MCFLQWQIYNDWISHFYLPCRTQYLLTTSTVRAEIVILFYLTNNVDGKVAFLAHTVQCIPFNQTLTFLHNAVRNHLFKFISHYSTSILTQTRRLIGYELPWEIFMCFNMLFFVYKLTFFTFSALIRDTNLHSFEKQNERILTSSESTPNALIFLTTLSTTLNKQTHEVKMPIK